MMMASQSVRHYPETVFFVLIVPEAVLIIIPSSDTGIVIRLCSHKNLLLFCFHGNKKSILRFSQIKTFTTFHRLSCASNHLLTVIEGSVYTTTIVADSECILSDEVSITMGGIDITNNINSDGTSVYNNGMITIENVTGNIIITAVAIDNYVPTWDIGSRTQKVYSSSIGAGDQKDLSRKFYYVGFAGTGAIHPSYASDVVVEGNNVTFTAYKNVGIGLPMPLEVGATYVFSGEASTTSEGSGKGRLYVNFLNEDGTYISSVNSSSGTNLSIEFTVPENAYWTVLNPVAYQGDNGDTVLNDTVTYTNLILTKQEV